MACAGVAPWSTASVRCITSSVVAEDPGAELLVAVVEPVLNLELHPWVGMIA